MSAQPVPDAFDRFGQSVSERASPMVVKEIRQGLRTRTFWIFFTLLLIACMVGALIAFAASSTGEAGGGAFIAFFSMLSVVQFFVIPFTAYRSMAREQDDETWVLLTLTGMGPRRVIFGKITSFVLQGALYSCAAAPFLLFSYFLNGIGLPTILFAMCFAAAYQVFLVSIAVSIATAAHTKLMRSLLQFAVLAILFQGLMMGIGGGSGLAQFFRRDSVDFDFIFACGCVLFAMLSTAALLFESAAAGLSLTTENYSRGPRIAFLVQIIGGTLLFAASAQVMHSTRVLPFGSALVSAYAVFIGTYIAADLDGLARILEPKRGSVLSPGAYRGFILVTTALLLCNGVLLVMGFTTETREKDLVVMIAAPAFALFYLALPHLVGRVLPRGSTPRHVMVRIVSLAWLLVGSGLPPLIGALVSAPDDEWLNLLNPVVGIANIAQRTDNLSIQLVVIWLAAVTAGLATLGVLRRNDR